jgi:predicted metal-dependent peptidase
MPPAKKHLWRGVMLPSVGSPGPRLVVCAVDTSGSVGSRLAARFLAEVHALRSGAQCRLHVLQCDAAITSVATYEAWERPGSAALPERFAGRGGTDFRPVFDWVAENVLQSEGEPDLLAFLTDGDGPFPAEAPPYRVVWLIPDQIAVRPPFGLRISITANEHGE